MTVNIASLEQVLNLHDFLVLTIEVSILIYISNIILKFLETSGNNYFFSIECLQEY